MVDHDVRRQHALPANRALDDEPDDRSLTGFVLVPPARQRPLCAAELELDADAHQLFVRGHPTHLTHKEFLLLRHLLEHAGRVCHRRELLDAAWGVDYEEPPTHKSIEVFIRRIRRRLAAGGASAETIRTVRGVGYIIDR